MNNSNYKALTYNVESLCRLVNKKAHVDNGPGHVLSLGLDPTTKSTQFVLSLKKNKDFSGTLFICGHLIPVSRVHLVVISNSINLLSDD